MIVVLSPLHISHLKTRIIVRELEERHRAKSELSQHVILFTYVLHLFIDAGIGIPKLR